MTILYLGFYMNEYPNTTLSNFDYDGPIDSKVMDLLISTINKSQGICPEDAFGSNDPDCMSTNIDSAEYWASFQ